MGWGVRSLLAIVCLIGAIATAASGATAAGKTYNAGIRFLDTTVDGERLAMTVWHPTTRKEGVVTLGPFVLKVASDAPLAPGRFGLIVLSHGTGGGQLNHRDLGRALARAGWVVAAVHHRGDNWQDGSRSGTRAMFLSRPKDVSAAIDAVLADKALGKAVDRRKIGAVGHSAGGYTILALLGAKPDLARVVRHCTVDRAKDPGFCAYGREKPGGAPRPLTVKPDRRIRAAVLLAPVGAIFGADAFKSVTAKIRLYRAGADTVLRFPFHAEHIHRSLPVAHEYVVVPKIGHFTFIAPFPAALQGQVGPASTDPPGVDRAAVHVRLNREIVAFFARALK